MKRISDTLNQVNILNWREPHQFSPNSFRLVLRQTNKRWRRKKFTTPGSQNRACLVRLYSGGQWSIAEAKLASSLCIEINRRFPFPLYYFILSFKEKTRWRPKFVRVKKFYRKDGPSPLSDLYMIIRILKTIQSLTGSQCSSFRRKWLILTRWPPTPKTSRMALFCTCWSLEIAELIRPKSTLLLASSLDVTNACTKRSAGGRSMYFRIRPILETARHDAWHTLFTCEMRIIMLIK